MNSEEKDERKDTIPCPPSDDCLIHGLLNDEEDDNADTSNETSADTL